MTMKKSLVLLLMFLVGLSQAAPRSGHWLTCYAEMGQKGHNVTLNQASSDLADVEFDNMASSCCASGTWILYDKADFNYGYPDALSFFVFGDGICFNLDDELNKKVSSARFAGSMFNPKEDALTLYSGQHFNGKQKLLTTSKPYFLTAQLQRSLILTGCSSWTVYQDRFYEGRCACIHPSDEQRCHPTFLSDLQSMGSFADDILSVQKGCHCDQVIPAQ